MHRCAMPLPTQQSSSTIGRRALSPKVRIALLLALIALAVVVAHATGFADEITPERLREIATSCGALGAIALIAGFALGEIVQLPGVVFVAAALAAYGPWMGTGVAYLGMLAACVASFAVGRLVAGGAAEEIVHPRVRLWTERAARAPVTTVALVRAFLFVLPGTGYAFSVSSIRFRDHAIGSAIGLVVPALIAGAIGGWVERWLAS